jgi:hypothetical protein
MNERAQVVSFTAGEFSVVDTAQGAEMATTDDPEFAALSWERQLKVLHMRAQHSEQAQSVTA